MTCKYLYNEVMIVIYTAPGCASCRKVKTYLKDKSLEYIEKNIFTTLLNEKEIKYLISRSDNGTDDIISKRSKLILENKINIDDMSIDELCKFIVNNPSILRRPIIIDNKTLQIGYDEEEIEVFNKVKSLSVCDKGCPHYEVCGSVREEND